MKINIKNAIRNLIFFLIIFMTIINFFCENFRIPVIVRYVSDLITIILLIYMLKNLNKIFQNKFYRKIFYVFSAFIFASLIGFFLNFYSIFLYIWGIRNIGRFFVIFFCVVLTFDGNDINEWYRVYNWLFVINIAVSFFQYLILGYYSDEVGGTFRLTDKGGNSGLLLLIIIETIYILSAFLNKKTSFSKVVVVIGFSVLVSIFAEMKAYYLIFIVILFISLFINKVSFKTIMICFISICILILGYNILVEIDINSAETLSLDGILEYAGGDTHGYSSEEDISRMRAFSQIDKYFFNEYKVGKWFGYGLGSCDVSGLTIFNSPFYLKYGERLHHTWFMHAMLYLEMGYIGYGLYLLFLIMCIYCYHKFKVKDKGNVSIYNSGIIIAIVCIILTWYNSSLRNDYSFFVYVSLAIPFVQYAIYNKNRK